MTIPAARRDGYCGGVVMLIGAVAVWELLQHRIGTLVQMQAGYFPLVLGIVLILLGLAIGLAGLRAGAQTEEVEGFQPPDWRGFAAITIGVASFIGLGASFGLLPATFCSVFIAAVGDRLMTWRSALLLAAAITVVAIVLFSWLLRVQFPVLAWPFA